MSDILFQAFDPNQYLLNLSVDIVIIGYENDTLKCLLLKVGDKWLLPGGFIKNDESVDHAANRVLLQRTGLDNGFLQFFTVFGQADRVYLDEWNEYFSQANYNPNLISWMSHRRVTMAYYSLVNISETHPVVSDIDEAAEWFSFDDLPAMWMDHAEIALGARYHLKREANHQYHGHLLLDSPFTMPELHQLHQLIGEEEIDRSRFQKKMLASGLFKRLPKRISDTPGRNPYQYEAIEG